MRHRAAILLAIAAAAIAPQTTMAVGAGAVSVLLESLPYLVVAALCSPLIGRYARALAAYAGCGCAAGPSARSIPAAVATAAIFGLPAAVARVAAAIVISRLVRTHDHDARVDVLGEIVSLIPAALLSAAIMLMLPSLPLRNLPAPVLFVGGALLGVVASPCALGGVALAASLHATAPFAGAGVLCTAGIVPNVWRRHARGALHDPWAYGALALACALVATRHGGALVHPRMTIPLALTAFVCLLLAWRFRTCNAQTARLVAAAALAAIVIGAPVPAYRVTETTLADGFAGERVDFTGVAVAEHGASALVRYAITCCRADAAPVALALDRNLARFDGRWMHASGTLQHDGAQLRLHVERLAPITPPADPFVYH
jgi:hypothetical protein